MTRYVAVTGCAGFIGKHLTEKLLERGDYVYGIDALTYAADPQSVERMRFLFPGRFTFVSSDIRLLGRFPDIEAVLHLAAETHVDNSLTEASRFVETNVNGTVHLLDMCLAKKQHGSPRMIYVSTDEVYGSISSGLANPDSPLNPTSPYAASKAAADLLVQAWGKTFGTPYTIVRPTNTYGPGQYPEKLIPKCVRSLLLGRPIPVHGNGEMVRSWLSVDDLANALILCLDNASTLPPILNVGGNTQASVVDVATKICEMMGANPDRAIEYGFTRPAVDERYAVDDNLIRQSGWTPRGDFWSDLPELVAAESTRFRF